MKAATAHRIHLMWTIYALAVVAIFIVTICIYNGVIGYMPPVEELKNPRLDNASVVMSADSVELGRYYSRTSNHTTDDINKISPHVINALIATEDVRFHEHSGVDLRGTMRAIVKTGLMSQKSAGGGSTITQQLAKQLYSEQTSSRLTRLVQKPVEWMIAVKLERFFTKDEILKMYLNQFDFLYNAVGINAAAHTYFGKSAKDLDLGESATLVGMVKNPAYYNPKRAPERATERRNVVLDQMVKAGMLSDAEASVEKARPIELRFEQQEVKQGMAPYYREEIRRMMMAHEPVRADYPSWNQQQYVTDSVLWATNPLFGWIEKNPKPDGTRYDLYSDGLTIYTGLDSRAQQYAEEAVKEHMMNLQSQFFAQKGKRNPYTSNRAELSEDGVKRLIRNAVRQTERWRASKEAGMSDAEVMASFNRPVPMTIFTYDGPRETTMTPMDSLLYMKSLLRSSFMAQDPRTGEVKAYVGGFDYNTIQYDMVSQARRQIGSTAKPFLYTYALEEGMSPCTRVSNRRAHIKVAGGGYWSPKGGGGGGSLTLRQALTTSNNTVTANIMKQLSPAELVRLMHNFGITTAIKPNPTICLGTPEISMREMVGAYTAFANEGIKVDPIFVTKIVDGNGNTVARFTKSSTAVISRESYWRMLSMLLNVVSSGTGRRIRSYTGAEMGGKTGTTNDVADGWFMGFTPQMVCGAWVGGDERYIHLSGGQGATLALPIVGKFLQKIFADGSLGYSADATWTFPDDVEICDRPKSHGGGGGWSGSSGGHGSGGGGESAGTASAEASIEGAFD